MRPGTERALPEAELQKLLGFGKDMEKNRAEVTRLLAEAGRKPTATPIRKLQDVWLAED